MKNKKECNLVKDLLPNYLENLTNADTNEFIDNHIKTCNECSNLFERYKNTDKTNNNDKIFINYAKKFNLKFNILKWIILIILLIFLLDCL